MSILSWHPIYRERIKQRIIKRKIEHFLFLLILYSGNVHGLHGLHQGTVYCTGVKCDKDGALARCENV